MRNTKERGKFTLFVYRERPNYYVGVCLEFDLIQEGKNAAETLGRIRASSLAFLKTVRKKRYSASLLTTPAPDAYWGRYYRFLKQRAALVRNIEERLGKAKQEKLMRWDDFINSAQTVQDVLYDPRSLKTKSMLNV